MQMQSHKNFSDTFIKTRIKVEVESKHVRSVTTAVEEALGKAYSSAAEF